MTFNKFVTKCLTRNAISYPEQDFIDDMERDSNFPKRASKTGIEKYLRANGACYEAIDAFHELWERYAQSVRGGDN